MKRFVEYASPFLGNGETELGEVEGIAASWFFIKAQTGNTNPGACLPFGMVSVCPYSGAYVSGYGKHLPSYYGAVGKISNEYRATGFTHFHQSGTGGIGKYYNYIKVTPLSEGIENYGKAWPLIRERAHPGYYSAELDGTGIKAELTVSKKAAFHRYSFAKSGKRHIMVDFSAGGLMFEGMESIPQEVELQVMDKNTARGRILVEGITVYAYISLEGLSEGCRIMKSGRIIELTRIDMKRQEVEMSGIVFCLKDKGVKEYNMRIGFSLKSFEKAEENIGDIAGKRFEEACENSMSIWNEYLGRICVEGGSEDQKEIFYSLLYHSIKKPADFGGENPFTKSEEAFYVDFATLWDQYKTHTPLMLTFYPEHGRDAINSCLCIGKRLGEFPNAILLCDDFTICNRQGMALLHYSITDGYFRGIGGIEWETAVKLMMADIFNEKNRSFLEGGKTERRTHVLDLSGACFSSLYLLKQAGDVENMEKMLKLSGYWINVYDRETGRLEEEGSYYEGGLWNYSFRLLHDMKERISLYKREEDFVRDLDSFFGYGKAAVRQPEDPTDADYIKWGISLNRFEGYNNEPDMEVPYAYIYAGRHDRTCEIVRSGMKYMFAAGRGGLPGNDDSGGLSSCYVWNAIGLFPVAGQPVVLIGSPVFDRITLNMGGKRFVIKARNNSEKNIYIQEAFLDGKEIRRAYLWIEELYSRGELELVMGSEYNGWAKDELPPSRDDYLSKLGLEDLKR